MLLFRQKIKFARISFYQAFPGLLSASQFSDWYTFSGVPEYVHNRGFTIFRLLFFMEADTHIACFLASDGS